VQMAKTLGKKETQLKYALITNSIESGADVLKVANTAIHAVGGKVVYSEANVPVSGTVNYQPFAQAIVASGANVVFNALGLPNVLGLAAALKSAGFKGADLSGQTYLPGGLGANVDEESALQGTYVTQGFPADEDQTPAVKQAIKELKAVGAPPYLSNGASVGYWSAQLFISMLQATLAKVGSAAKVTPDAMYKVVNAHYVYKGALSGGLASLTFPQAIREPNTCYSMLQVEGTSYVLKQPYSCNGQLIPVG
jgi:ABC-type branched-subunit amino acid transport system substrate-binding protein